VKIGACRHCTWVCLREWCCYQLSLHHLPLHRSSSHHLTPWPTVPLPYVTLFTIIFLDAIWQLVVPKEFVAIIVDSLNSYPYHPPPRKIYTYVCIYICI
jgi:hypothetical protein